MTNRDNGESQSYIRNQKKSENKFQSENTRKSLKGRYRRVITLSKSFLRSIGKLVIKKVYK